MTAQRRDVFERRLRASLCVVDDARGGVGLACRQDVAPRRDVVLLEEAPVATVLHADASGACHVCGTAPARHRCSRCRLAVYCSSECQRRVFAASHRRECEAIGALEPRVREVFDERSLLVVRLALSLATTSDTDESAAVLALQTHWEQVNADAHGVVHGVYQRAAAASRVLQRLLPSDSRFASPTFAATLVALLRTNALGVCDEAELVPFGVALYPRLALLEHSCAPNCVVAFRGTTALLRPLRAVRAGEPLTIAYVDVVAPREQRQARLRAQYNFECRCAQCSLPPERDLFDARRRVPCAACGGSGGGDDDGTTSDARCAQCTADGRRLQRVLDAALSATTFDAAMLTRALAALDAELTPTSLAVRRLLTHAQHVALRAALAGDTTYAAVLPWATRLLAFEQQRERADEFDPLITKQRFAVGRVALECGVFELAFVNLRLTADATACIGVRDSAWQRQLHELLAEADVRRQRRIEAIE